MIEKVIDGKTVRKSIRFPNYGCTQDGIVYRWDTEKKMRITLQGDKADGTDKYLAFRSCHNNKPGNTYLHVMVADCWLPNNDPVNKVCVNHKDGNKRNPTLNNLEWVTESQNQRHALRTGLKQQRSDLYNATLSDEQVHLICQRVEDGWRAKDLAETFDVSVDIIRKIKAGDTYFTIRNMYNITHKYLNELSETTVRWVCERINEGFADKVIAKTSTSKVLTSIEVKRIRYKIRYRLISDEYF